MLKMMRPDGRGRGESWADQIALPRARLGLTLVSLAVVFFGVNFCQKVITSMEAQQRVQQLQADITAIDASNRALQGQIAYYKTKPYVNKMAREKFVYRHEGDTVFAIEGMSSDLTAAPALTQPAVSPPRQEQSWWRRLLGLFGQ